MKSLCFAKRARNLVLFVRSSCHCGVKEKGTISKEKGGCPVSSFANLATKRKYLRLQHSPSHSVISTYKAQFCDTLQFIVYNNLPDRLVLKPCHITQYVFLTHSQNRITHVEKKINPRLC